MGDSSKEGRKGFRVELPLRGFGPGERLILSKLPPAGMTCLRLSAPDGVERLRVGDLLYDGDEPLFRILGKLWWPPPENGASDPAWLVEPVAFVADGGGETLLHPRREGAALAWITVSDKGAAGKRSDESGPLIEELLSRGGVPLCLASGFVVPDEQDRIRALAVRLALEDGYDLVVTTGGTGVSPRDVTPEAILPLLDKRLDGFERAMTRAGAEKKDAALIARPVAGALGRCLILCLPGSPDGVLTGLEAVMGALPHALDKAAGSTRDCAC